MRGRTYQFNVNQIAAQIASTTAGAKMKPVAIAKRAADIVDATYAEAKARNAADVAAAIEAHEEDEDEAQTLHTAEEIFGDSTDE